MLMSVVWLFLFVWDEVDGDDGDVGDADVDEDESSREAFEDDGGELGVLCEIVCVCCEIVSLFVDFWSDVVCGCL